MKETLTNGMRIEIGCGKAPKPGYKTCDIRNLPNVDYVCSADSLPFESNSVAEIFSRHVVEHFTLKEFLAVLEEWNRVLRVGGELYIICPNLLWHLEQILNSKHESFYEKKSGFNDRYWGFGSLFGWQQDENDLHKFGYYFELLRDLLTEFGFGDIQDLTNSGKGIENEIWHLEVRAFKKTNSIKHKESKFFAHFNVQH